MRLTRSHLTTQIPKIIQQFISECLPSKLINAVFIEEQQICIFRHNLSLWVGDGTKLFRYWLLLNKGIIKTVPTKILTVFSICVVVSASQIPFVIDNTI